MKTIPMQMIVLSELAIRCRADLHWQSFDHVKDHGLVGWSGEDNLILTEQTAKDTSLSFNHHLSPRPNQEASHCTSTTIPTSEPLPRQTDLGGIGLNRVIEDHVLLRPVASPHDIDSPPMEIDSPRMEINSPRMEIDSPRMEIDTSRMEIDTPRMEIDLSPMELGGEITQPDTGATVDQYIPMNKKELPEYQLVFGQDISRPSVPSYDEEPFEQKWQCAFKSMEHTRSGGQLGELVVTRKALYFIRKFNRSKRATKGSTRLTYIVSKQITRCLKNSMTWRTVYHRRLGIDFHSAERWIRHTVKRQSPNSGHEILRRINGWFLIYIILVDMIITILPNGKEKQPVERIQSFQTAVTCFEDYTRRTLSRREGFGNSRTEMRVTILWRFITHWKEMDENYAWLNISSQGLHRESWKNFFHFIFAFSIQHFTKTFKTDLDSKLSH